MKILVLNAGSSSQKSRLYDIETTPALTPGKPLWEADADWTKNKGQAELKISANGHSVTHQLPTGAREAVIEQMLQSLWSGPTQIINDPSEIDVVGHRVVHGGPKYRSSTLITPEVKNDLQHLIPLAPLHNPASLDGIDATMKILRKTPQVAVFDTAFHSDLPIESAIYPGPYSWYEEGIRRYGAHGTSHRYCAQRSAQLLGKNLQELRLVNCHLGNGSSLAAIREGRSIDTTMGLTPLEGLMMGTRSGTVDPSILIYLQRQHGYSADQLEHILNYESGLKGISDVSSDMRQILQAVRENNERATLALNLFIYRLRYFIGAMLASLGGLDVLTFTGGIGEHTPEVRAGACAGFGFLNLELDQAKNAASPVDEDISTATSAVRVLVVHTEEDWEIARDCWHLVHDSIH